MKILFLFISIILCSISYPQVRWDLSDTTTLAYGVLQGKTIVTALCERESMSTTATGEDIWRGNELTPAPTSHTEIPIPATAGEQMTIVSESGNDDGDPVGTGVRTLRIEYIQAVTGLAKTEDIIMNGTTEVDTVATDVMFVNDMYSLTVGSNTVAAGHIKIYKKGTVGLVYNMITLGGNKSLVSNRMVPSGKKLILKGWHGEEAQAKRVNLRIRSTNIGTTVLIPPVFLFKGVAYLKQTASGELKLNTLIPALSIVKISGWADQAGAEVGCGWWGVLITDQ